MSIIQKIRSHCPDKIKDIYRGAKKNAVQRISQFEENKNARSTRIDWAPIFILGPPRTGTTLIYQTICSCLKCSYLCNGAVRIPEGVATITEMISRFHPITPEQNYDSFYGETKGWNSPNQGRSVWAKWFPSDQSVVGEGELDESTLNQIRGTVSRIEQAMNAPFINKSQGHCVRIRPILEALPEAIFLQVDRSKIFTVQSILRGRRTIFNDENHWFSVKPTNFNQIQHLPPIRQICEQVHGLETDMEHVFSEAEKSDSVYTILYEDFCESPQEELDRFGSFYQEKTGKALTTRLQPPDLFSIDAKRKVSRSEFKTINSEVRNVWGDNY